MVKLIQNLVFTTDFSMRFSSISSRTFFAGAVMLLGLFFAPQGIYAAKPVYTVDLLVPAAGDVLRADTMFEITWKQGEGDASFVDLFYSEDAGVTWEIIEKNIINDGSYHWTVAHVQSREVLVKIVTTDLIEELASDVSGAFSVWFYEEDNSDYWEDGATPSEEILSEIDGIAPGDFVNIEGTDSLYYIDEEMARRPLFNEQTYFTYEDDMSEIATVSDNTIHKFAIGAPLSPQAGTVLVKTPSIEKVYWIDEGRDGSPELRWVTSEEVAAEMFGADWNAYVLDIDPTLFTRYEIGKDIDEAYSIVRSSLKKVSELHV